MSEKIDPREVLAYLNELGYTNITAQQLKEFIKDLKKIIKYDSRYGGGAKKNPEEQSYHGEVSDYCRCSVSNEENPANSSDKENCQPPQYNQEKNVNRASSIQKDKHIAVHIYDTKNRKYLNHEHCVHVDLVKNKRNLDDVDKPKAKGTVTVASSKTEASESTIRSIPPVLPGSSRGAISSRSSKSCFKEKKPKVTFIRPTISKSSFNKSDPVALYHYYQSQWKNTKIPGQDSRDDLRWAIREKMLSGPKVEVKSRCNIPRCGWIR